MKVLLLRLAGPMQAWGDTSRFTTRQTRTEPTKSGVLGLLASAQGRRRTDPIEDLAALTFGVRVDQRGRIERDFQTAIQWHTTKRASMPLSYRYHLTDAVFVAAVGGDDELVRALDDAVRNPAFPLYLGRRACVPVGEVSIGVYDGSVEDALRCAAWQASSWYRRHQGRQVSLDLVMDAPVGEEGDETVRDVPLSYDPERREYGWRDVVRRVPVLIANELGRAEPDFFAALGGG